MEYPLRKYMVKYLHLPKNVIVKIVVPNIFFAQRMILTPPEQEKEFVMFAIIV
jgi:hypothetical protein